MAKMSRAAKQRYNQKAYDRLAITVPKGQKQAIEEAANAVGNSSTSTRTRLCVPVWGPGVEDDE